MTLVVLVIAAVFAMLNWFAPALVALRGATAVDAMKASFMSCLRNWVPFLVYGLIAIAVSRGRGARCSSALAFVFGAGALFGGDVGRLAGRGRRALRPACCSRPRCSRSSSGPSCSARPTRVTRTRCPHADAPLANPAYR